MHLAAFVSDVDAGQQRLTVRDPATPAPIGPELERTFDETVTISDADHADAPADLVELTTGDYAVATHPGETARDALVQVNADLSISGPRPLDAGETPEVVAQLEATTFPIDDADTRLLTHISRQVEALALETGGGVLHAGFEDLSGLVAEPGTETAYRLLAAQDVDLHIYGRPDWSGPPAFDCTVHAHVDGEIPESWFVVHDGDGADERKAALVATATGADAYRGFWTFRPALVDDVLGYLERTYCR